MIPFSFLRVKKRERGKYDVLNDAVFESGIIVIDFGQREESEPKDESAKRDKVCHRFHNIPIEINPHHSKTKSNPKL